MSRYLLVLVLLVCVGCCTSPLLSDESTTVIDDQVEAWKMTRTYIALTDQGATDIDGATSAQWLERSQAWLANALLLQAAAKGERLTYAEAYERAEELTLP